MAMPRTSICIKFCMDEEIPFGSRNFSAGVERIAVYRQIVLGGKDMSKYKGTQTEKNLEAAFAGESQARNKYTYFAS